MLLRVLLVLALAAVIVALFAPVQHVLSSPVPGSSVALSVSGSAGSSRVLGRPSLSASFVDRVLSVYGSPAIGLGQTLYHLSLTYGIDDAYALAFFWHESSFGRAGVALLTHSLGNIRCTPGWSCYQGYRSYSTWQAGALDWFHLLSSVYIAHGLVTLEQIIPVYAPSSDHNDEGAYIAAVRSAVSAWRAGRVQV